MVFVCVCVCVCVCAAAASVLIRPTQNPYLLSPTATVTHKHSTVLKSLHNDITVVIETTHAAAATSLSHTHTRVHTQTHAQKTCIHRLLSHLVNSPKPSRSCPPYC